MNMALRSGIKECIGILTDAQKSPQAIAKRALDYGYKNYQMIVGESLEGNDEKITSLSLAEAIQQEYQPLNCVLLIKKEQKTKPFGIPDSDFDKAVSDFIQKMTGLLRPSGGEP